MLLHFMKFDSMILKVMSFVKFEEIKKKLDAMYKANAGVFFDNFFFISLGLGYRLFASAIILL
jgi:hypothetical protein